MGQAGGRCFKLRALAVIALAVSSASCGDGPGPVSSEPDRVAFAPGGNRPLTTQVKVRRVMLDGDLFEIDGVAKAFSFEVDNSGSTVAGVRVEVTIVQGTASRVAAAFAMSCAGAAQGVLPQGLCTMASTATASNSATGTGTLVQGDAQFIVTIVQDGAAGITPLGSRKTGIALVPGPQPPGGDPAILDVSFPTTSELIIDGPNVTYLAELSNPTGTALGEAFVQGLIEQGDQSFGAGGVNVLCAPDFADAVLPTGTCEVEWSARAVRDASGNGPAPGPAQFVLILYQGFGPTVELDRFSVPVTIAAGPSITSLDFPTAPLVINGARASYQITFVNPTGTTYTGIGFQTRVVQGTAERPAGGFLSSCPVLVGEVPPGSCTMSFTAGASNDPSEAALLPGPATFVVIMSQTIGTETVELDRISVDVTLVASE